MLKYPVLVFLLILTFKVATAQSAEHLADSLVIVDKIEFVGNKVTIDKILLREITVQAGDTLSREAFRNRLVESSENLMNTSLFNFADLQDTLVNASDIPHYQIKVEVTERWYIFPLPIFELAERNFSTWWQTKDLNMINYGLFLDWQNFRGRKEHLKVLLQFGYDEKLGVSYMVPYIDKKQHIGLSFGFSRTKNHSISYITQDNQVQRIRLTDKYAQKTYEAFLAVSNRPDINQFHNLEASYNDLNFNDTIPTLNPLFYGGDNNRAQYFKLSYFYKNDHRDYKSYPLKGYYFDLLIEKLGFGLFSGTDINVFTAKANIRKFWKLHEKWYFASGFTGRFGSKGSLPYFTTTGLGYGRDYVRGYEYYVVDGQDYGLIKTDLKFALIPQRVTTLKFIPTDKFNKIPWAIYLSLYGDAAFAPGNQMYGNDLQNTLLVGYGAGINLVTYYDMVFRVEYSFNKMGESGLFISFIASI